ncbi:MAG: leucine-rich repeat protein [Prevotella sp.]|nr:leucine-rich repeat protein [Prevotella sp.]
MLRDCCEKGKLTGIDMSQCRSFSSVPDNAFLHTAINGKPGKRNEAEVSFRCNLRYISLPNTVLSIGENAFACTNLEAITLPHFVKTIGDNAFLDCIYLKNVAFIGKGMKPDNAGLTFSGLPSGSVLHVAKGLGFDYRQAGSWNAFSTIKEEEELYNTEELDIDGSRTLKEMLCGRDLCTDELKINGTLSADDLDVLRYAAQYGRLTDIDLTDCVIDENRSSTLSYCRLESLRLPRVMKKINGSLLSYSRVNYLVMPEQYEVIGASAFEGYKEFVDSTLIIPEGCRVIRTAAFRFCSCIKKMVLPSTLDELHELSLYFVGSDYLVTDVELYVNRMIPPEMIIEEEGWSAFGFSNEDEAIRTWRLFVPIGAKKNYESDENWNMFTIIETPLLTGTPSGIAEAVTTFKPASSSAADGIYTVDGRLVTRDTAAKGRLRGLYVVRENGTARKVVF